MQISIWIQGRAENSSPLNYEIPIKAFGHETQNKLVNLQKKCVEIEKFEFEKNKMNFDDQSQTIQIQNTLKETDVVFLSQKLSKFFRKINLRICFFFGELSIFFGLFLMNDENQNVTNDITYLGIECTHLFSQRLKLMRYNEFNSKRIERIIRRYNQHKSHKVSDISCLWKK